MDIRIRLGGAESAGQLGNLNRFLREISSGEFTKLPTSVIEDVNNALEVQIRKDAAAQQDPSAVPHAPLSRRNRTSRGKKYVPYAEKKAYNVGNTDPDLRYGYTSAYKTAKPKPEGSALDGLYIDRLGEQNTSAAYFKTSTQADYMRAHQYGDGLPRRRWFPQSEDYRSPNYSAFRDKAQEIIARYINDLAQRRLG